MKRAAYLIPLVILLIVSSANAQAPYRHAIGGSFGNYIVFQTSNSEAYNRHKAPHYGFSAAFEYRFRPSKVFALQIRLQYRSFADYQKVTDQIFYDPTSPHMGEFDPVDPEPLAPEYYPVKFMKRYGSLGIGVMPNVYVATKKKVAVYLLAGPSIDITLHKKSWDNLPGGPGFYRQFLPEVYDFGELLDVSITAGAGFEHQLGNKCLLNWEPVIILADVARIGRDNNSVFRGFRWYVGINTAFTWKLGKTN